MGALNIYRRLFLSTGLELDEEFPINIDPSSWPMMRTRFTEVFLSKTRDEWVKIFESKDACVAPVLGLDDAKRDPHNIARGAFVRGRIDGREVFEPAPAPKLSRTPARDSIKKQPIIGEHTVEFLLQEGFPKDEIDQLLDDGVIKQHLPLSSL